MAAFMYGILCFHFWIVGRSETCRPSYAAYTHSVLTLYQLVNMLILARSLAPCCANVHLHRAVNIVVDIKSCSEAHF